jgi:hypothetical protein
MQRLLPPPPSLPHGGMQPHPVKEQQQQQQQPDGMRRPRGPDFAMIYAFLGSLFDPVRRQQPLHVAGGLLRHV